MHPYVERFHEVFGQRLRFIRYATAAVLAFILALPATSHWQEWLLFRNSVSFGVRDPQFHVDVGFYVFELPFLSFAIDWLFAALIIVLLLTMAAHLLNGGVLFTSSTPTVRPATRVHFAVLLALLAAVKAADYWLTRYALTNETRGFVQGATYTVVNAQIPALMLLDADRAADGRPLPLDDPVEPLAVADRGVGAVARDRTRRRVGLSGARAVGGRAPEPG